MSYQNKTAGDNASSQQQPRNQTANRTPATGTAMNQALNGNFGTIFLNGRQGNVVGTKPYDGTQLYTHASMQTIAGVTTLVVDVDENGPSTGTALAAAAVAVVNLKYTGGSTLSVTIPNVGYTGQALSFTVSVVPSGTPWSNSTFSLSIVEGTPSAGSGRPAGYVIVKDFTSTYQLRWVAQPVSLTTPPESCQFIPPGTPTGIGIAGPFGFENP